MKKLLSSLQWALFILMGSIVVPVVVASSYGLNPVLTVEFVQRTLFVLGMAGILQTLFGHKLPIQEGPAGLWWGVFSLYAGLGPVLFGSHLETLRALQFAFILSGIIFIVFSLFGWVEKIANYISPTVVGVYLILMVAQLSGSFLQGMSGLNGDSDVIQPTVLALSLGIVVLSYMFMRLSRFGHYSVLFTIVFGWMMFSLFDLTKPIINVTETFKFPEIFAFGTPSIEPNMVIMVVSITFLLLANMLASVKVVQNVMEREKIHYEKNRLKETGIISGVNQLLGGCFSAIGAVPISGSAGFIMITKITSKLPFLLGSLSIVAISFVPSITAFVASIPEAVGYAAILPVFSSIISLAFQELDSVENKQILYRIVSVSLFGGIGVMFIPSEAFTNMSPTLASILSNGLVFGAIIAVVCEALLTRKIE